MTWSLAVYCGSRHGRLEAYTQAAKSVGWAVAGCGGRLVYGGGRVGLMGEVANAALERGATVLGVIPESLMAWEVGHTGLSHLEVVADMATRKQRMAQAADAFLALPGGIGTLEELMEMWSWQALGLHRKPIGVLNVDGYYDTLWRFMQHAVDEGFMAPGLKDSVCMDDNAERLVQRLKSAA